MKRSVVSDPDLAAGHFFAVACSASTVAYDGHRDRKTAGFSVPVPFRLDSDGSFEVARFLAKPSHPILKGRTTNLGGFPNSHHAVLSADCFRKLSEPVLEILNLREIKLRRGMTSDTKSKLNCRIAHTVSTTRNS